MKNNIKEEIINLGFKHLGSGWYGNESDNIRIRFCKNDEIDFWLWRDNVNLDENQIHFRGKIHSIEDVRWVLERCFNFKHNIETNN